MKGIIVKSWVENDGMVVEKMGDGESAGFCKARLDDLCN
jgi:hypothetical protein